MDNLSKLKEYMGTYTHLDSALQDANESEESRDEKSNFDLFDEESKEVARPSYYSAIDEESDQEETESDDPDEELNDSNAHGAVDGWDETLNENSQPDDNVSVEFARTWSTPVMESSSEGKTLHLAMPDGLNPDQVAQWLQTVKALFESAKYWNLSECRMEVLLEGVLIKERQMTPDLQKVTPKPNNPPPESMPCDPLPPAMDVWEAASQVYTLEPKRANLAPMDVKLKDLFSSRAEFLSVGGSPQMSWKEAIILGLRYKKLYNQARLKYSL
ncbi:phosphoprotein [Carajas virus]|uniref:Phosphoprotein n=1 Tax=Carajas virus TaxID=239239 RepID=A0A0D3R1C6_9RHAB|nr:phosphoprotein [Carajas virus]AJR28529.1 phosphoprotein [Carajas virus]